MFLVSLRLNSLAVRFGHRRLLAVGAILFASYPFFLGLARGPGLYWVAAASGGIAWGLVSASMLNRLMDNVPKENRSAGMAFHNVVLSLGILIGSLLGPMIGECLGAQPAVLVGSGSAPAGWLADDRVGLNRRCFDQPLPFIQAERLCPAHGVDAAGAEQLTGLGGRPVHPGR